MNKIQIYSYINDPFREGAAPEMGAVFGFGLFPYRTAPSLKGFFCLRELIGN
jgi:hypothetical protein